MSGKQLWVAALAVVAVVSSRATAQNEKNQLTGIAGRRFISHEGIKAAAFSNPFVRFGKGFSFEVNYSVTCGCLCSREMGLDSISWELLGRAEQPCMTENRWATNHWPRSPKTMMRSMAQSRRTECSMTGSARFVRLAFRG